MQQQPNVPYQAYKPKRHNRDVSAQNQAQNIGTNGYVSRPQSMYSEANGNGYAHGHNFSEPVVPLQRDFPNHSEKGVNGKEMNGTVGVHMSFLMDQTRRTASISDVIPPLEAQRSTSPPTVSPEPAQVIKIITKLPSSASSDGVGTSGSSSGSEQSTPLSTSPSTRPPSAIPPTVMKDPQPVPADATPAAGTSSLSSSTSSAPPDASSSSASISPRPVPSSEPSSRKGSTFRRIPLRQASSKPAASLSSLRPQSTQARTPSSLSQSIRVLDPAPARTPETTRRIASPLVAPQPVSSERALPPLPAWELSSPSASRIHQAYRPYTPAHTQRSTSVTSPITATSPTAISPPPHLSTAPIPSVISPAPSTSSVAPASGRATPGSRTRTPALYRPGFQPKGVYRPRTDEFLETRKQKGDKDRVERTRLERRLEKLINLHFPHPDLKKEKEKEQGSGRPAAAQNRRASSFFDIDISSLKGKSAGDLWKGVVQAQAGGKNDIRAAEQAITPWEDDASVSQCPLCQASFHPLTNRKHHCRLCGRIVCSLPAKFPQRPQTCSLLFVADPITGQIEEVGEGVDYGVRRRTTSMQNPKGKGREDALGISNEEKFLRGVRICRECKPVLLRRQYMREAHTVPLFTRLYEAFISIEKEIEETLPQFQELMLSLNNDERPSPEASAARKRLLEAFAQYDAIAKRIRKIPCKGGPGGSQDRVQQAIVTRANIFLQKNMFPLQALPKPSSKKASSTPSPAADTPEPGHHVVDPESDVARALQPLLEQEALLESFVEEAKAQRKFEDTQTLKANLNEIRAEIDRILAKAEGGLSEARPVSGTRTKTR